MMPAEPRGVVLSCCDWTVLPLPINRMFLTKIVQGRGIERGCE